MRLARRNTLFCVRECGGGDATLAAKFILAEAGTRMRAKNAIPLIACTVGSHASAPRNDQEQKHGGLAIVKTGVVPTTLTSQVLIYSTKPFNIANTRLYVSLWQITITDDGMTPIVKTTFSMLLQHGIELSLNGGSYQLSGTITDEFMQGITGNIWFGGNL